MTEFRPPSDDDTLVLPITDGPPDLPAPPPGGRDPSPYWSVAAAAGVGGLLVFILPALGVTNPVVMGVLIAAAFFAAELVARRAFEARRRWAGAAPDRARRRWPHPPQYYGRGGDDVDLRDGGDRPRRPRTVDRDTLADAGMAMVAGEMAAVLAKVLLSWNAPLGLVLTAFAVFLGVFYLLLWDRTTPLAALDRVMTVTVWASGFAVCAVLGWMTVFVVVKGIHLLRFEFFTHDMADVGPLDPGGGASHAIIGTLEQVGMATIAVVPIAILTAVYLHEIGGRMATPIRFIVNAMSGLPSIVAGLLVFSIFVEGSGFSGAKGALALAILMLPTVTRTAEEILRTVPSSLREASLALGAPQWRVVRQVVVPTARAGLVTAVLLGVARTVGETAPVLLTAFGSDAFNANPFDGPQADLPLFVWQLIRLPNETQNQRAWTGALVLLLIVLVLFVLARVVSGRAQRRLRRN